MARLLASLLLVWSFFAAPALCAGGLLEHPCDCGIADGAQCQHEDSCSGDPCASVATPRQHDGWSFELGPSWIPVVAMERHVGTVCAAASPWSPQAPPDRSRLPYARSDRPLLI